MEFNKEIDQRETQKIIKSITDKLPKKWEKIAFYYAFCKNVSSYKFYVNFGKGYFDCFDDNFEKYMNKETIRNIFRTAKDILKKEREDLPNINTWGILTFEVDSKGTLKPQYKHKYIEETSLDPIDEWEEPYRKNMVKSKIKKEKEPKEPKKFKEKDISKIIKLDKEMTQKILYALQWYLPDDWQEVVFYVGYYKDDCGFFKYYVKLEDGSYTDCYSILKEPDATSIVQSQFMYLHKTISSLRVRLPKKQKWVCMVITFTSNGKFYKDYDYADGVAPENLMEYVETYKNKLNAKYLLNNK